MISFPAERHAGFAKKHPNNVSMCDDRDQGPLLRAVLETEGRADVVLRYPSIGTYAGAAADVARYLRRPVLWPVGDGGQRLLGALELLTKGAYEPYGWRTSVGERVVLLIATVGVSGLEFAAAAVYARGAGATEVHGCAVDAAVGNIQGLDTFSQLVERDAYERRTRTA
jgi:hypothetical protein